MDGTASDGPLAGTRVVERAGTAAAAYAGRLLAAMGADVVMAEPLGGSRLRAEPPFLDGAGGQSALFSYLSAGKRSVVCDLEKDEGRGTFAGLLAGADILIDDTPLAERSGKGLDREGVATLYPRLVHLSVLPFGACGPKAGWRGQELNLIHASGEGFLLPNGLSIELFPDRPPLKIHGHFISFQAGTAAALGALSALWARDAVGGGQFVDVSVQDAGVAVGAFAVQRLGDGSLEHRRARSFKYGGVLECRDGFVELLTLEERQWTALVQLMGSPAWAAEDRIRDPLERSRHGEEINGHIRAWARLEPVAGVVASAQELGVPMAPYNTPDAVLRDPHERARGLFQAVEIAGLGERDMLVAPFRFGDSALRLGGGPPDLDSFADSTAGIAVRPTRLAGGAR